MVLEDQDLMVDWDLLKKLEMVVLELTLIVHGTLQQEQVMVVI